MSGGESGRSFEYTPTWVVAVVCFVIVFISLCAERGLHRLGKFFKHKNQEALYHALQKVKEELMLLGFISLLLTVFQGAISGICVPQHISNIMLPCILKPPNQHHQTSHHGRRLLAEAEASAASTHCSEGNVPFLSLEALHHLHIFIFVLAVVYVIFCATTMVLGGIKIGEWAHWERWIQREASRHSRPFVHPLHLQEFFSRTGNYWRKFTVVSWMAAFFKQFYGSVTKSDYVTLRAGFIREHCPSNPNYDFHRYMLRTLEYEFKTIIGISWYLWLFVVIFLLVNIAGWHTYFWLSFLPLVLLLIVGTKLEHIITKMAQEAAQGQGDVEVDKIRPSDELFWFNKPSLVLYLIHFILFQNSFEIAFFFWIWSTYGFKSCIMDGLHFIIPRLVVGVIVQVLCSYSTLPLYALVAQMGSMFKQTIFEESTKGLILDWIQDRKPSSAGALAIESSSPVRLSQQPVDDAGASTIELSRTNTTSSMPPSSSTTC